MNTQHNHAYEIRIAKGQSNLQTFNDNPTRPPEQFKSWLWPDHTIGKHATRQLREEHNALVNAHMEVIAQRDELLAAAKEARMALTLDYHGCTKPKKALCDLSPAASQAYNKLALAIASI